MKHVISFDNDGSWEENTQTIVCVATDASTAAKEVKRLTAWLDKKKEKYPVIMGSAMEQDAWLDAEDKRREKINRMRCPYGCDAIRDGVQHNQGHFLASAVPDANLTRSL